MEIFYTKNLFIATFLLCHPEITFIGTKQLDVQTKLFKFTPKEKAEELEGEYFRGARVSAKDLFNNYNTLKDLLFQRETNGGDYGKPER